MSASRFVQSGLIFISLVLTAAQATGQQVTPPQQRVPLPDIVIENGIIEGRVVLPSGRSVSASLKVELSNDRSPLVTLYTNSNGEFRFINLREGTYYVKVASSNKEYDPIVQRVSLNRSGEINLLIYVRPRADESDKKVRTGVGNMVVSVAELDQKVPAQARKEYEKASKLVARGEIQKGIYHLKQALAVYPEYMSARNNLGVQYLKLGMLDEAEEQFKALIQANPQYFNSKLNLGIVLVEQKKYLAAIGQLNEALSLDSAQPAAHLCLGIAFIEVNDLLAAEREMVRALVIGGAEYIVARYYLANIYLKMGRQSDAVRELTAYIQEKPSGEQAAHARWLLERLASAGQSPQRNLIRH